MPVHDMTRAASSIVGLPATGKHARCPECRYGTVTGAFGAAILVDAASCPARVGTELFVACDWSGCKAVLHPVRVAATGAKTCNELHRGRAWKERTRYGRHDAVVVRGRANGPHARKKPSGLQVSWGKAVEALADHFMLFEEVTPKTARLMADEILRPALSDRQRALLDARERSSE